MDNKINSDYTYCSGWKCPVIGMCKRYNIHAFNSSKEGEPLYWTSSQYNNNEGYCPMFEER